MLLAHLLQRKVRGNASFKLQRALSQFRSYEQGPMNTPGNVEACVSTRRVALLLASLLAVATLTQKSACAQTSQAEPQKTTVSGVVINAVTRVPVPRALVTTPDNRYATFTDSSGQFEFDMSKDFNTSPSPDELNNRLVVLNHQAWINARKPGFIAEGGRGVLVSLGKQVTIALTPEALIVGRVTFSTADTTSHVTVQLYSRQTQDGLPRWTMRGTTQTNSAGEFRFAELQPGQYRLSTNESLDNDPGAMMSRNQVYGFPPLYYPGAPDFATAGTIEVAAGQTVQSDLSLVRQPYYSVRIPINGDTGNGLNVIVSSQGHRGPGYSLGFNAGQHRIEGLLPNGNYVVDAISFGENAASGTTTLRVAGGPAEGPALTIVPNGGIALNVKEELSDHSWNSTSSWSVNGRVFPINGPRRYLSADLQPADDFGQGVPVSIRPPLGPNDDSMVLTNVPPGRYWLRLNSARGYVASATMGGIDLLHQPLVVTAGSAASVDVTIRDDYASFEGQVTGLNPDAVKSDDPDSQNTWVYLVPSSDSPGQFQEVSVSANETFTLQQIAPGSYRALAFAHPKQDLPYRDPQAMKTYETKGQIIHLSPGQKASLQLPIIPEE